MDSVSILVSKDTMYVTHEFLYLQLWKEYVTSTIYRDISGYEEHIHSQIIRNIFQL
jgi:hypothetical protein